MELTQASWAKTFTETLPADVAEIIAGLYGPKALEAAMDFGITAYADQRHGDCLLWLAVYDELLGREAPKDGKS